MRIAGTEYNLNHEALEIYISGCNPPHCKGCHNEELWDFNVGEPVKRFPLPYMGNWMIKKIWIMGGEPQDQDMRELQDFIYTLKNLFPDVEFWLWTRYTSIKKPLATLFDVAKFGPYRKDLPPKKTRWGITLASNNQKIVRLNKDEH